MAARSGPSWILEYRSAAGKDEILDDLVQALDASNEKS
jgi:hypothetical protein